MIYIYECVLCVCGAGNCSAIDFCLERISYAFIPCRVVIVIVLCICMYVLVLLSMP